MPEYQPRDPMLHVPPAPQPRLVEALTAPALHIHLDSHLSALLTAAAGRILTLEAALADVHRAIRGVLPPEGR